MILKTEQALREHILREERQSYGVRKDALLVNSAQSLLTNHRAGIDLFAGYLMNGRCQSRFPRRQRLKYRPDPSIFGQGGMVHVKNWRCGLNEIAAEDHTRSVAQDEIRSHLSDIIDNIGGVDIKC